MKISACTFLLSFCCVLPLYAQSNSAIPAGIQELHREDIAATLSGNPQRLANLFTEDAVLLEPGGKAQLGRAAILAENLKEKKSDPEGKELEYQPEIHGLQVHGNWAVEWTYFTAVFREKPGAPIQRMKGKALRVLERQPDGSWKFSHVAWNTVE